MPAMPIETAPCEAIANVRLRSTDELEAAIRMLLPEVPDRWLAEIISRRMESVKANGLLCADGETVAECLDTEVRGGIPPSHEQPLDDFIYSVSGWRVPRFRQLSDAEIESVARGLRLKARKQRHTRDNFDIFGLDRYLPRNLRGRIDAVLFVQRTYRDGPSAQLYVFSAKPSNRIRPIHYSQIRNAEELRNNLVRAADAVRLVAANM